MPTLVIRPRYERDHDARVAALRGAVDVVPTVDRAAVLTPTVRGAEDPGLSTFVQTADARSAEQLRSRLPSDVLVEEMIEYHKARIADVFDLLRASPLDLAPFMRQVPLSDLGAGSGGKLTVRVKGPEGRRHVPLRAAEVYVFLSAAGQVREQLRAHTDAEGEAIFRFADFYSVNSLIVMPYSSYWPKLVRGPRGVVDVLCEPLPRRGPSAWWHEAIGVQANVELGTDAAGAAIKVGVIDSGCGPHDALPNVVDHGAFIRGQHVEDGSDSGAHGTHVCGIIAARLGRSNVPTYGIAPGVELHSVRVFEAVGGANQGDIADAIDLLVREGVRLINMSLGGPVRSTILAQAIANAMDNGVLCVCAAGNDDGPVAYPAADADTVAVSAIGRLGMVPEEALPAIPSDPDRFGLGQFYSANFTNFGDAVDVCAPGVGIISPVPKRHDYEDPFVAMNGTSMASPMICAMLAALLAPDEAYMEMQPDRQRARYARNALLSTVLSIDLPRAFEGNGLPNHGRRTS